MSEQLAKLFRVQFATMESQGDKLTALQAAVNGQQAQLQGIITLATDL